MSASAPIPFALGQPLWFTGHGVREVVETCEECAGNRAHSITLGNGETFTVACEGCGNSYHTPPTGRQKRIVYEYAPVPFTPRRVRVDGNEVSYSESEPDSGCYSSVNANDLFATREECEAACAERNVGAAKRERERVVANMLQRKQKMAWSVHYWRRLVKDHERQAADARARLSVVIAKKGDPDAQEVTA